MSIDEKSHKDMIMRRQEHINETMQGNKGLGHAGRRA
jgi:hypothetical protein